MTENPLLQDAPAILRARLAGSGQAIEGASCLGGERPPNQLVAAMTAIVCVAMASIWSYVYTSPDMPGIDPVVDYAWYIPTSGYFPVVWLALTLGITIAFYLILRSPLGNAARIPAIAAFLAQLALKIVWAWLLFGQRAPVAGLYIQVLFVICIVATVWLSARVDRLAAFLMAPYVAWVAFVLALTASKADLAG